jgi:hypothetical protein
MLAWMKAPFAGVVIAGAVAILPTSIIAQLAAPSDQSPTPTTKPANSTAGFFEPTTRPFRATVGVPAGGARNRPGPVGRRADATQEEIQAAIEFFSANSPHRMSYFNRLLADSPVRVRQSVLLAQLYRPILNFKEADPKLYGLLVQQVQLRDEAFDLARTGKVAELREKARQIVSISLEARTLRLGILQKQIADQQSKLDYDKANQEAAVQREASEITTQEKNLRFIVERVQRRDRGQSMLDADPAVDPLADLAPIVNDAAGLGAESGAEAGS